MIEITYLYQGLCALARAHQVNCMAGHLGAALVAGYFFSEDNPDLDRQVYVAIAEHLDRIVAGAETIWYDQEQAGIHIPELFASFPFEEPQTEQIASIAAALAGNIDKTRQSGHNVIFAMLGLRALYDHPEYATPSIIEGIRKLVQGFNDAIPGQGYYGDTRGWIMGDKISLPEDADFAPYSSEQEMANVVIGELVRDGSLHRRGFGGLVHITNHAAALSELARYGFPELAQQGWPAHNYHVRLWRSLPDLSDELGALRHSQFDPRTPAYWDDHAESQASAHLTHRIKTLYGFFTLLRLIEDPATRAQAEEQFRYLMA